MRRHVPTLVLLGLGVLYVAAAVLWAGSVGWGSIMADSYRRWLVSYLVAVQFPIVSLDYDRRLGIKVVVQFLAAGLGFSGFNRAVHSPDPSFWWLFLLLLALGVGVWVRQARFR